ncbi:MAG: hypothetical protein LKJ98_00305 [Olsenella sp.]|jgi:adenine-specific DNA-methyltransferase|nr:hypothetical protein [Olsenella sp.]
MPLTTASFVQSMVERANKLGDPVLAADIQQFANSRRYGLIFEHNRPERIRLYGKKSARGDVVQILPERGKPEDESSHLLWRVNSIDGSTASLIPFESPSYRENSQLPREASVEDIVAVAEYDQPIYAGLREVDRVERGTTDDPYQVVISAENYHALETLSFCYSGKVDCIYIDPPYNTGAKDWKYNNDYVDGSDEYRHSKWLAFMERRLKLAKKLLNPEDSVLIVTIDEKEYLRLGLLLEQVFPEARIQMVSIANNPAAVARADEFGRVDEYAFFLMFGVGGPAKLELGSEWITSKGRTHTGHIRKDLFRRSGSNAERRHSPGCFYPIYIDERRIVKIGKPVPPGVSRFDFAENNGLTPVFPIRKNGDEGVWMGGVDTAQRLLDSGYLWIGKFAGDRTPIYYYASGEIAKIDSGTYQFLGKDANGVAIVSESCEDGFKSVPGTQWHIASHDSTQYGSRLLNDVIGKRFSYPKSLYAVHDTLKFFVADKSDALIVDFFAGSGTTLHAVNLLNAEDGGHRRCICVTNNEVSAEEQKAFVKEGLRPGDDEWEARGIARYVTWTRTKCSIEGVDVNGNPLKGDYGCPVESYDEIDGDVTDPETGKKIRGKVYKKAKRPSYPALADLKMSDGFRANAIFFDLTYENPDAVELGSAFDDIAPLLWLRAGSRGRIIQHESEGYAIADTYAILFDYSYVREFMTAMAKTTGIGCVYVVTDDETRCSSVRSLLPGIEVVRLYESYLRSFKIAAEGAVM